MGSDQLVHDHGIYILVRRSITAELLSEEGGFTLPELLVAMVMMLTVMFALYSIFDMSIKVFGFGNDKVEAAENARIGLDKMARELRAAYPASNVDTDPSNADNRKKNLFWTAGGSPGTPLGSLPPVNGPITFGNDLNGNRMIYDQSTGAIDPGEQITYSVNTATNTLQRNGEPVAENVKDVDGDNQALTFTYLDAQDKPVTTGNPADIRVIRIKLEVSVKRGISTQPVKQTLQTNVTLRNRAG